MNMWLNGARTSNDPFYPVDWFDNGWVDGLHLVKSKLSELVMPPASQVFVFMEPHERSIDDGYFRVANPVYAGPGWAWADLPSGRHNRVGNVSFADGHTEPVKWKSPKTFIRRDQSPKPGPDLQDLLRVQGWVPVE